MLLTKQSTDQSIKTVKIIISLRVHVHAKNI